MSFLGRLFGTDKATEKVIGHVAGGLDKLIYTDQEQATDAAAARREGQAFIIEWLKSTTGSRLARRVIALMMVSVWLALYLAALALNIAAVWVDAAEPLRASAALIYANIEQMTGAVMLILAFYFAAPHMGPMVEGALKKFGKTP